jgi:hypothetical protein
MMSLLVYAAYAGTLVGSLPLQGGKRMCAFLPGCLVVPHHGLELMEVVQDMDPSDLDSFTLSLPVAVFQPHILPAQASTSSVSVFVTSLSSHAPLVSMSNSLQRLWFHCLAAASMLTAHLLSLAVMVSSNSVWVE